MATPVLDKVWQFALNIVHKGSVSTPADPVVTGVRNALLDIKNQLIGFAFYPWQVYYSGTSTVTGVAGDGVDRWLLSMDLVWGAGLSSARSFMVLRQPQICPNFQVLLDLHTEGAGTSAYQKVDVWVSPSAGFTGGTTTARPTAIDEVEVTYRTTWTGAVPSTADNILHIWMSTDGECTRILHCFDGHVGGLFVFDQIKAPRPELDLPFVAVVLGTNDIVTDATLYGTLVDIPAAVTRYGSVSTTAETYFTVDSCGGQGLGYSLPEGDDFDGAWLFLPIGICCSSYGARGIYGEVYDLWFGSPYLASGDHYDESENRAFCSMGHLIFVANGTTVKVQ